MNERNAVLEAQLAKELRGCCFARPPSPTRTLAGAGGLGAAWRAGGGAVHAFAECDSTMDRAHALVQGGAREGTLVFAQRQQRGRGRLGRTWESPIGGAYFSLILKPVRPAEDIPQLSLVAGLSAAEAVKELTGLSPSIRWPNDLFLDGCKVAGLLVEMRDGTAVLGVGINVTTNPAALPGTATSLWAQGAACDPYRLTATFCRRFDGWYDVWTAKGFGPLRNALRPWLSHVGQLVRLTSGTSHQTEGQVSDVDERGRLLVRLEAGLIRAFEVGEVTSLR